MPEWKSDIGHFLVRPVLVVGIFRRTEEVRASEFLLKSLLVHDPFVRRRCRKPRVEARAHERFVVAKIHDRSHAERRNELTATYRAPAHETPPLRGLLCRPAAFPPGPPHAFAPVT